MKCLTKSEKLKIICIEACVLFIIGINGTKGFAAASSYRVEDPRLGYAINCSFAEIATSTAEYEKNIQFIQTNRKSTNEGIQKERMVRIEQTVLNAQNLIVYIAGHLDTQKSYMMLRGYLEIWKEYQDLCMVKQLNSFLDGYLANDLLGTITDYIDITGVDNSTIVASYIPDYEPVNHIEYFKCFQAACEAFPNLSKIAKQREDLYYMYLPRKQQRIREECEVIELKYQWYLDEAKKLESESNFGGAVDLYLSAIQVIDNLRLAGTEKAKEFSQKTKAAKDVIERMKKACVGDESLPTDEWIGMLPGAGDIKKKYLSLFKKQNHERNLVENAQDENAKKAVELTERYQSAQAIVDQKDKLAALKEIADHLRQLRSIVGTNEVLKKIDKQITETENEIAREEVEALTERYQSAQAIAGKNDLLAELKKLLDQYLKLRHAVKDTTILEGINKKALEIEEMSARTKKWVDAEKIGNPEAQILALLEVAKLYLEKDPKNHVIIWQKIRILKYEQLAVEQAIASVEISAAVNSNGKDDANDGWSNSGNDEAVEWPELEDQ